MNTKKKVLRNVQVGLLVSGLLFSNGVLADPPGGLTFMGTNFPKSTVDLGRAISGIIAGVINLCGDGESKAQLIATQETTNKQADGTGDDEANAATTQQAVIAASALTNGAYDYVASKLFSGKPYKYGVLKNELGSKPDYNKARQAVINVFFAKGDKKNDRGYMEAIRAQRQEYAQVVTKYHMELGRQVQKKITADLAKAAAAPVSSENEVGAMAIDAQTLDEMIKITLADLTLQIELMEADAMAFMLHQRIALIDNPEGRGE